jgi:hypothetical protein
MSAIPRREPKTINTILPVPKAGEPGDEVVDRIVVVETFYVVVEFEGSVVTVMFPVLFEVVVRTVVVTGIVKVWFALVVSGIIVIIVGDGNCVVAFVVVVGGGRGVVVGGGCGVVVGGGCGVVVGGGCGVVVGGGRAVVLNCFAVDFFAGDLVGIPVVGLTVLLEVG